MSVEIIEIELPNNVIEQHVRIDHGNGEYTSMPKSTYDEQQAQAEQSTPSVTSGN
jgi:hypothetical protein